MIYNHTHEIITDNLFLRLHDLVPGVEVFLKIEGLNHAGSIKLKTALGMVEDAERRGKLKPGNRIIESSSGNLGIALSVVAANKGYLFTCVTDLNTSPQAVTLMRALGADVVIIDWRDSNGGFLGSRIRYIEKQLLLHPDLAWLNQYSNVANIEVHSSRTASAILNEIGQVDYLFIAAGTTGTVMGCANYFRRFSPKTKIIAVDAAGSVIFGSSPAPRHIPGLGASVRPPLCCPDAVDDVILINELDAIRTCRWLARTRGLLVGGSTGSVVAALRKTAPVLLHGSRIVAISPDLGDHYTESIYNDAWVAATFGIEEMVELAADIPSVATGG